MARNRKAPRKARRNRKALTAATAVQLAIVADSVVRPSDCACDHARIEPISEDIPDPAALPEIGQVLEDQVSSAASGGRAFSRTGSDGAVASDGATAEFIPRA